jgi:hypothetical protein
MADNTDDEYLDNPTNIQSENLSDEVIPIKDAETIKTNQETKNMEVHHHPDLHHKKKNFREYFLEFLMIFLAVTLGFFAESIRENIGNNEHAKLLTSQLIRDLKVDTANLRISIDHEQLQIKNIDSLYFLLQQPVASVNTRSVQQLVCNMYSVWGFGQSTGAISAIERELNIKQFTRTNLPELIADYKGKGNYNKEITDLLKRLLEQNVEPFFYAHFTPANAYSSFAKSSPVTDKKIRNLTQQDMTELSVKIEVIYAVINAIIHSEEDAKAKAEEIIKYVTNQYHLENE